MKKMMVMIMVMAMMLGVAATVNAAEKKDIKDYVAEHDGEMVSGSKEYFEELLYNSCTYVEYNDEKVNFMKEADFVGVYKANYSDLYVIFEYEDVLVVVDTDNMTAQEL